MSKQLTGGIEEWRSTRWYRSEAQIESLVRNYKLDPGGFEFVQGDLDVYRIGLYVYDIDSFYDGEWTGYIEACSDGLFYVTIGSASVVYDRLADAEQFLYDALKPNE